MRTIPLARSTKVAVVDDWHHGWLSQHTWYELRRPNSNRSSYAFRRAKTPEGKATIILMHREIMGLEAHDPRQVDHRDHDGLNNLESNLRISTPLLNAANRPVGKDSRTGMKGVNPYRRGGYTVSITKDGRPVHLGLYDDLLAAGFAYNTAATILYGEHAGLNPVPPDAITLERQEAIRQAVVTRLSTPPRLRRRRSHRPYHTWFDAGRNRHRAQALLDDRWRHIGCYRTSEEATFAAQLATNPDATPDPAIDPARVAAIRKRIDLLLAVPT